MEEKISETSMTQRKEKQIESEFKEEKKYLKVYRLQMIKEAYCLQEEYRGIMYAHAVNSWKN